MIVPIWKLWCAYFNLFINLSAVFFFFYYLDQVLSLLSTFFFPSEVMGRYMACSQ